MRYDGFVEPDLTFIEEIRANGGNSLKKCFQCATCSVSCNLSPDLQPFPRKEMLYAGWGLKDRLVGNPDIWQCFNCGDCSQRCPRGAKPGETLGAIRRLSIKEYSKPLLFNRILDNPKFIPLLFLFPLFVILVVGFITGWMRLTHDGGPIEYAYFFPVLLIEVIFIPLSILVVLVFAHGIKKMLSDMRRNYFQRGITNDVPIKPIVFVQTLLAILPSIIKHQSFAKCNHNKGRKKSHMLVAFSFFNLAMVAGIFVFALYFLNSHAPFSQLNPIKIFANLSGIALLIGGLLMIKERLIISSEDNRYFDWYLVILLLLLGLSGLITQFVRLVGWPTIAIFSYITHLILAFNLIAFLPYSKFAHFIYRTVALTFSAYARQENQNEF